MATIAKKEEKVAELIELAHDTYTSVLKYNDENSSEKECCIWQTKNLNL